ncbi:MAG TPA: histidine kinase dimerization/phospho-acceptor domain-containing protein, partial [Candidatus Bathyarchaeia archaeon]|nr:histidine kinase dimerization/phospho-acceptor domain-containing protein [Candidatus Bathyarchaeia archaeon]
ELKTPIQPILSLTEVLRSQINDVKQREILEVTIRNAKRLQRLSNDILDVSKIEGLPKYEKIKLLYNPHQDILIKADKGRISQVISNL